MDSDSTNSDVDIQLAPHFTDYYEVDPTVLRDYGALDISVMSDLPLFIDPFLLFNSDNPEYQALHQSIIRYLIFLPDKSVVDVVEGRRTGMRTLASAPERPIGTHHVKGEPLLATTHIDGSEAVSGIISQ